MTHSEKLNEIKSLLGLYIESGSRQVLTRVRQAVTVLLHDNPLMVHVLEEAFADNQLSMDIL